MQLCVLNVPTQEQACLQRLFDLHVLVMQGNQEKREELRKILPLAWHLGLASQKRVENFVVDTKPYKIWPDRLVAFLEKEYA